MSAIVGLLSAIFGGISAAWKIGQLIYSLISNYEKVKHNNDTESAVDGIGKNDNIAVERGINNPDAGVPSGIGEIREKKK